MSIPKIILLVWFAWAALNSILLVGKERKPFTPKVAAASVVMTGIISFLVVIA